MPRKKPKDSPPTPLPEPEIIPADEVVDLGGMSPQEFHRAVYDGVQEALGNADILVAGAVLDETLADYLQVVEVHCGWKQAREAAVGFGRTVLPYAMKGLVDPATKYGELRLKKKE